MDSFLTWEYLLSFAGCVTGTALVTEFIKKLTSCSSKVYQIISYFIALVILIVGHIALNTAMTWESIVLDVINAAVVSLASNGGYDAVKAIVEQFKPKTDAETEKIYEGDDK